MVRINQHIDQTEHESEFDESSMLWNWSKAELNDVVWFVLLAFGAFGLFCYLLSKFIQ